MTSYNFTIALLLALGGVGWVSTLVWLTGRYRGSDRDIVVALLPRCKRCNGPREWRHRCPDAIPDTDQPQISLPRAPDRRRRTIASQVEVSDFEGSSGSVAEI